MKGFTFVEILVSAAILSIIVAGIFLVLNIADMTWHSDMGLLDLQQQARQAMDGMVREIRQVEIGNATPLTINGSSIQFYIPDYSSSIGYNLQNSQLIRQHSGNLSAIANDIDSLSFCWWHSASSCNETRLNSDILQVQLNAAKTVRQRALAFSLKEQVGLRNEQIE